MELLTDIRDGIAIVTVDLDVLDAAVAKGFKTAMAPRLREHPRLVLEMGAVQFVDSAGLAALLYCLRQVEPAGGDVKLCCLTGPVRTLLELVRMNRVFDICETRDDALGAFGA